MLVVRCYLINVVHTKYIYVYNVDLSQLTFCSAKKKILQDLGTQLRY